ALSVAVRGGIGLSSGGARAETAGGAAAAPSAGMPGGAPRTRQRRRYGRLRPGDRVAVVAPSGPAAPSRLEVGCAVLRDLGLDAVVGKHALDRVNLGRPGPVRDGWHRLAGSDADRAADLQSAWCDPGVRAVICSRGGYGATRVLDHLDWDALEEAAEVDAASGRGPKILHGSSDITALHAAFGTRLNITTSFGPMPAGVIADLGPALPGTPALRPGRAEGPLTGGTLSLLTSLLATPYAPPPAAGCIVFLEDVSEAPYRVDRMLVQLLQSGWLVGAAGIALGTWRDCGDPAELDAVFDARLGPLGVPILAGFPAGHGPHQRTLELGAPAVLDTAALGAAAPDRAAPPGGTATNPPSDPAQNPASNGSTGTAADGAAALTLLAPGGAR